MRVDFYQLSRDPAEQVAVLLARNTLAAGKRLLVVSADEPLLARTSEALWSARAWKGQEQFLAHGRAGTEHDPRQPILLSDRVEAANGAQFLLLADGVWREGEGFERAFLVFGEDTLQAARACWTELGQREGMERHFWRQGEGGGWAQVR